MGFLAWLNSLFASKPKVKAETANERILRIAIAEIGVKEIRGGENPRIIEYHSHTTGKFSEDEVPWCASFVCWVMDTAGLPSTKSALASSYRTWGSLVTTIHSAIPGDVIVWQRGIDSKGNALYHVNILAEMYNSSGFYKGLGGNQGDAVTIANFSVSKVVSVRRAKELS